MKMLRPSVRLLSRIKCTQRAGESAERNRLYDTTRWRERRKQHLAHFPLCVLCVRSGRCEPAVVLGHIFGHGTDWRDTFWTAPVQGLCAACNARKTALELRGGPVTRKTAPRSDRPARADLRDPPRD